MFLRLRHLPALPVLLAVSAAHAEPSPPEERSAFRLAYDVAPGIVGCPKERDFASIASMKFGYDLFPEGARAALFVRIRRAPRGLDAVLEARDENGQTQWEAVAPPRQRCRDLADDIASLVFARFLVPGDETWMLLAAPTPPAPDPPPAAPPPPAPAPAAPPPPASPPAASTPSPSPSAPPVSTPAAALPFKRELSAAFVFAPIDTPHAAFGGAVQVAVQWPWFSLGVELRGVVDHRGDLKGVPLRTWLGTGVALPCLLFVDRVRACLPVAAGMYQALGDADDVAIKDDSRVFFGGGLRISYEHPVGRQLWLRGYGELLLPMRRVSWKYGPASGTLDEGAVWRTPAGLPSLGVGITWKP